MGNYFGNDANSSYNALQVKVQQQMSHGLQFIAHYTWSRALNYNSGNTLRSIPRVAYGPDDQNRPRCSCSTWFTSCRSARARQFGGNAGKAGEYLIIGGWQITSTSNYSAGLAVHSQLQRVQLGPGRRCLSCRTRATSQIGRWAAGRINTHHPHRDVLYAHSPWVTHGWARLRERLATPAIYSLIGPRSFTTDASIMKNFSLTERFNLQFRMDAFNLFNHPVLGFNGNQGNTCIDCINSSGQIFNNAGVVTNLDANVTMRELQFALRLSF